MNQYEELIYSLITNCNREITKEEMKILNQASAIYNTYNNLTEQLGCPLEVIFKALGHWIYDEDGNAWYIEHYYQECNVYQLHSVRHFGRIADKKFNTKDYKETWWLKKDKSE